MQKKQKESTVLTCLLKFYTLMIIMM